MQTGETRTLEDNPHSRSPCVSTTRFRAAADRYPDDFVCDLGGGLTIRDDELGADDDEDVLG